MCKDIVMCAASVCDADVVIQIVKKIVVDHPIADTNSNAGSSTICTIFFR